MHISNWIPPTELNSTIEDENDGGVRRPLLILLVVAAITVGAVLLTAATGIA